MCESAYPLPKKSLDFNPLTPALSRGRGSVRLKLTQTPFLF